MALKAILDIELAQSSLNDALKDLDKGLDKSSKRFGRTFGVALSTVGKKFAKTAGIIGAVGLGAAAAALALVQKEGEKALDAQQKRVNQAQQIQTIATTAGEDPEQVAGLVQGLQAEGFTFEEATKSVANFVDGLDAARLGQDPRLINLTQEKDLTASFDKFIKALQSQDLAVAQAQQGGILEGNAAAQTRLLTGQQGTFQPQPSADTGREISRVADIGFQAQQAQQQLDLDAFTQDLKSITADSLDKETKNTEREISNTSNLLENIQALTNASDEAKDAQQALVKATRDLTSQVLVLITNFSPTKFTEAFRTVNVGGTTGLGGTENIRNASIAPKRSAGQINRESG